MATHPYATGTEAEAFKSKKANRNLFYLDNKLYQKVRIDNGHDSLVAWSYPDEKMCELSLSYVKRKRRPVFSITQAAFMLNRSRMNINHLYLFGVVPEPQRTYPIGRRESKGWFRLSEEDVYALHDYYANSRRYPGFSRSAKPLPSKRELASMMKYNKAFYVQTTNGDFVPTWSAPDVEDWF